MCKNIILWLTISLTPVLMVTGCSRSGDNTPASLVDNLTVVEDSLTWTLLPVEEVLPIPMDITVTDSSIVYLGLYENYWIHTYDKQTGKNQGAFLHRGRGPEEVVYAANMNRLGTDTFSVYDMDLSSISNVSLDPYKFINSEKLAGIEKVIWQAWTLSDTTALIKYPKFIPDNLPLRAYSVVNLQSRETMMRYDGVQEAFSENPTMLMMQSRLALSPDKRHFASATVVGGTLEFFEIGKSGIDTTFSKVIFPLKFKEEDGMPRVDGDPTYGFTAICASTDKVYTAYAGSTKDSEATKIAIWDWSGKLLHTFNTNYMILKLAIDPQSNAIYGVVAAEEGFALARLSKTF